jgi:branched-chain amino acid aminotransferase
MRVIWLDDGLVAPDRAMVGIDDPGLRYGEGLLETMRAERGAVALLDRHLDRMEASALALGLEGLPTRERVAEAVAACVAAAAAPALRVRVTVTPLPTLLVEAAPEAPLTEQAGPGVTAATLRGAWFPGLALAEHKTLSYLGHRWAGRRARGVGAERALLLDAEGRLGEADGANAFCVLDGELVTAPARGLLPGVTRAAVMGLHPAREAALPESGWRRAQEIFLTSAVQGVVPVVRVDGEPVGRGVPGPVTRELRAAHRMLVTRETAGR